MTYTDFSVVSSCPFLVVILQFEFVNVKNLLIVEKIGVQIEKNCPIEDGGGSVNNLLIVKKIFVQIEKKSAIKDEG